MRTPFNNIKLSQLFTLCNIVNTSEIRDIENIRRKYLDYALSFDETLSLLEELKIIKNESGKLSLKLPFSNFLSIEEFKKILISAIFSANEDISDQLRNFLENVLAGYDIKSFENYFDNNSMRIRRYIEVKAVSLNDFKFYWSKNEMLVAKVYGERYYLYLLPVKSNNVFDFNKLMIVKNPFKNIYLNEFEWKKVEENISISKNI